MNFYICRELNTRFIAVILTLHSKRCKKAKFSRSGLVNNERDVLAYYKRIYVLPKLKTKYKWMNFYVCRELNTSFIAVSLTLRFKRCKKPSFLVGFGK